MNKAYRWIILLVAAAILFWGWTVFFPNPRKAVSERLNKLARLASFEPNEGNYSRMLKVQRMGTMFADNVEVMVDVPGYEPYTFHGRAELMQAASAERRFGNGVKAQFLDMNIEVAPDNISATVDLTLKAKLGGESDFVAQELKFTLKNIKGDWLITRVETVKTLKP